MKLSQSHISIVSRIGRRRLNFVSLIISVSTISYLLYRLVKDHDSFERQERRTRNDEIALESLDTAYKWDQEPKNFDITAENWDSSDFCYPDIFRSWRSNVKEVCKIRPPDGSKKRSHLRCYEYNMNGIVQEYVSLMICLNLSCQSEKVYGP